MLPIRMRPAVGLARPAMARRSVVLPEPDGPRSVQNCPRQDVQVRRLQADMAVRGNVRRDRLR